MITLVAGCDRFTDGAIHAAYLARLLVLAVVYALLLFALQPIARAVTDVARRLTAPRRHRRYLSMIGTSDWPDLAWSLVEHLPDELPRPEPPEGGRRLF